MIKGARHAAVSAVVEVLNNGRSLSDALPELLAQLPDSERALAQALAYGVLRHRRRLEVVADRLLTKRLRARDRDVQAALLVGLYQLTAGTVAEHAAVSETAGLGRSLGKPWAVRLLNATLRRYQRERDRHLAAADRDPAVRWSLPDWLLNAWQTDWLESWEQLASNSNVQAPMTLRVNRRRCSRADYAERLAAEGLGSQLLPGLPEALTLERALSVTALPGFETGDVSVQDGAAQYAAPLLAPEPGDRVLDACAAPGGKTDHLNALCPEAAVVAVDQDEARLRRVQDNLDRLGGRAELIAGDAATPATWWDGGLFDRILLDAPCSGTGVIRRHPDIKWLRRSSDIGELARQQRRLLDALWPLLRPGGKLVYATCSVVTAENEDVVADFAGSQADASCEPPELPVGWAQALGHRILTGDTGMDGFYYACLRKG